MPPRFRRPEPMTTFELVPDDEREDGPDGAPHVGPEQGRRLADLRDRAHTRWRALSRRGRAAVAGGTAVVVVVVAGAAVAPGLLDARAERLRADDRDPVARGRRRRGRPAHAPGRGLGGPDDAGAGRRHR
ncbi:hypothetical protein [Isoptericola sp. NPDC056618]|uniref:hypothetical protein n=1 Tax=unclassified Isoptericola TaxID=2623355 RepID=UPI0036478C71